MPPKKAPPTVTAPALTAIEQRVQGWVQLPFNNAVTQLKLLLINPNFTQVAETFQAIARFYDNPGQRYIPLNQIIDVLYERCPKQDIPALTNVVRDAFRQIIVPNWWKGAQSVFHLPMAPSLNISKKPTPVVGEKELNTYLMPEALQSIDNMLTIKTLGLNDRLHIYSLMLQWLDEPMISQELRLVLLHRLFTAAGYLDPNGKLTTPSKSQVAVVEGSVFTVSSRPQPTLTNKNPARLAHTCITNDGQPTELKRGLIIDPQAGKGVLGFLDGKIFVNLGPPQSGEPPTHADFREQRLRALVGSKRHISIMSEINTRLSTTP